MYTDEECFDFNIVRILLGSPFGRAGTAQP